MWLIFFELVSGCNFISISIWFQYQRQNLMLGFPFLFASYYQNYVAYFISLLLAIKYRLVFLLLTCHWTPFCVILGTAQAVFLNSNSFLGYEQVSLWGSFHMSSLVFLVTFIPLLACFIAIKEYEVFFFTVDILTTLIVSAVWEV